MATSKCDEDGFAILRMLVDAGADVCAAATDNGETPLICASRSGNEIVVQMLLEAGADKNIDHREMTGWTARDVAYVHGHSGVVDLLELHGARESTDDEVHAMDLEAADLFVRARLRELDELVARG